MTATDPFQDLGPRRASRRMLAFLHLPKTGGDTLRNHFIATGVPYFDINNVQDAARFVAMPRAQRQCIQGAFGHMPYGVHRFVEGVRYSTFLRDPVERVVSAYLHILRVAAHPLHQAAASGGMTLRRYATENPHADNAQTRRLALYPFLDPQWWLRYEIGALGERQLDEARATLEACAFIGFFEDFELDARRWARTLDVSMPGELRGYAEDNASEPVDEETREMIRGRNLLDCELYAYGRRLKASGSRDGASRPAQR